MKDKNVLTTEEQVKEEAFELTGDFIDFDNVPLPLSYEGISTEEGNGLITYDVEKFKLGVEKASEISGFVTALINTGLSEQSVVTILDMTLSKELFPEQAKLQKELAQIEAVKIQEQYL